MKSADEPFQLVRLLLVILPSRPLWTRDDISPSKVVYPLLRPLRLMQKGPGKGTARPYLQGGDRRWFLPGKKGVGLTVQRGGSNVMDRH